ncbi:TetR/AcrR family transcriptional regulator [Jatrophihabitans sp. YIM 134969]
MTTARDRGGRPRSEQARTAILHAVDDLLVEVGYAALTMKGIAERAGVGRQTVYRWWSTKAEVLFEAAITDAARELQVPAADTTAEELTTFLAAVTAFLTTSDAGAGYRALVGEAQHDSAVAELMTSVSLFDDAAGPLLERARSRGDLDPAVSLSSATALLVGPVFFRLMTGPAVSSPCDLSAATLTALAGIAPQSTAI